MSVQDFFVPDKTAGDEAQVREKNAECGVTNRLLGFGLTRFKRGLAGWGYS